MNINKGYPCACCGFLTMSESESGTFEICPVCYWEDDNVQFDDIVYKGGANQESLSEARINFRKYGVSSMQFKKNVRAPRPDEIP